MSPLSIQPSTDQYKQITWGQGKSHPKELERIVSAIDSGPAILENLKIHGALDWVHGRALPL